MPEEVILWQHPATLRAPPHDARKSGRDPEYLRVLGIDLKTRGIRHPIVCRWVNGELEVITGESRRQAALLAGIDEVPVRVVDTDLSPGDLMLEQLLENDLRSDLTILDRAQLYVSLLREQGWNQSQLAHAVGRSPAEVNKVLAINGKLHPQLTAKVQDGSLPVSVGYALTRLPLDQQLELAQRYLNGELCRDGIEAEVTRHLGSKKPAAKTLKVKAGDLVILLPTHLGWEALEGFCHRLGEVVKRGLKQKVPFSAFPELFQQS